MFQFAQCNLKLIMEDDAFDFSFLLVVGNQLW